VLIVDYDENMLLLNSNYLKSAGYKIITAINGNECLEKVRCEKPDLILLDVNLADTDGFSICRKIKQSTELNSIFIVIFSCSSISSQDIASWTPKK